MDFWLNFKNISEVFPLHFIFNLRAKWEMRCHKKPSNYSQPTTHSKKTEKETHAAAEVRIARAVYIYISYQTKKLNEPRLSLYFCCFQRLLVLPTFIHHC